MIDYTSARPPQPGDPWGRARVFLWAEAACAAALLLNVSSILRPMLLIDDFQLLAASRTWADACANLWLPNNEHSMPLGRLSTWALVQLAGRPTNLPLVFALQGPLALVAGMVLVYLLVRRETGEPFAGLLAMALFGVNTHFQGAVNWFAASFAVLALDTVLLAALAAQRWRQTGRARWLVLSALWCALAPGWFASGVLAGPLCALYLFDRRRPLPALVPLLGTALSLVVSMPLNGRHIMNLPRVEVRAAAWETFDPLVGMVYTLRATVDDLIPGAIGFGELTSPPWVVGGAWALFLVAGVWWWWRAPQRRLLALGLGLIVTSYLLTFTARAYFKYEDMHHWGRYHLFAHLGLVLFVCGGLPAQVFRRVAAVRPRAVDAAAAGCLLVLFVSQCPRSASLEFDPQQFADLRRIEAVDERCREHRIDAATARKALPPFEVFGTFGRELNGAPVSGWDLLRGSADPVPRTVEEARRLLEAGAAGR